MSSDDCRKFSEYVISRHERRGRYSSRCWHSAWTEDKKLLGEFGTLDEAIAACRAERAKKARTYMFEALAAQKVHGYQERVNP